MTDTTLDDADAPVDPLEEAFLSQDPARLQALAQEKLAQDAQDAAARGWLAVALAANGSFPQGAAALKLALEGLQARLQGAPDADARDDVEWQRAALVGRFLNAAHDQHVAAAARLVVDEARLEHPAALRVLAAEALAVGQDAPKAMALAKRALAVDPSDSEALYLAARATARAGRKPNALTFLQKALDASDGTIAVRLLARYEPDFDGLRADRDFQALMDPLPAAEPLRTLYRALDSGALERVLALSAELKPTTAQKLDVLYPWREALELLLDRDGSGSAWEAPLEALQAEIDAHEAKDEESLAWRRFCGDA